MTTWANNGVILIDNVFPLTEKISAGDYIKNTSIGILSYNVIPSINDVKAGTAYGLNLKLIGTLISGGGSFPSVNAGRWSC
jgi:hypothetical protein